MPQTFPLTIVTGASRGLGAALVRQCLQRGHTVIGMARTSDPALDELAEREGAILHQWRFDLNEPERAAWPLLEWLQAQPGDRYPAVTLINNAGYMAPLLPLSAQAPEDTARALRVGLEAAMVLTGLFLRGTQSWTGARKVLNISSGLGQRPMASSAAYCAAKAGLDHFSRCVALEEALRPNGARVVSLAPGVIDTDMQVQLRQADPQAFPDQPSFARLHAHGQLLHPDDVARCVMAWLERPDFGQNVVADVRKP